MCYIQFKPNWQSSHRECYIIWSEVQNYSEYSRSDSLREVLTELSADFCSLLAQSMTFSNFQHWTTIFSKKKAFCTDISLQLFQKQLLHVCLQLFSSYSSSIKTIIRQLTSCLHFSEWSQRSDHHLLLINSQIKCWLKTSVMIMSLKDFSFKFNYYLWMRSQNWRSQNWFYYFSIEWQMIH